jgi:hypothetical protein
MVRVRCGRRTHWRSMATAVAEEPPSCQKLSCGPSARVLPSAAAHTAATVRSTGVRSEALPAPSCAASQCDCGSTRALGGGGGGSAARHSLPEEVSGRTPPGSSSSCAGTCGEEEGTQSVGE